MKNDDFGTAGWEMNGILIDGKNERDSVETMYNKKFVAFCQAEDVFLENINDVYFHGRQEKKMPRLFSSSYQRERNNKDHPVTKPEFKVARVTKTISSIITGGFGSSISRCRNIRSSVFDETGQSLLVSDQRISSNVTTDKTTLFFFFCLNQSEESISSDMNEFLVKKLWITDYKNWFLFEGSLFRLYNQALLQIHWKTLISLFRLFLTSMLVIVCSRISWSKCKSACVRNVTDGIHQFLRICDDKFIVSRSQRYVWCSRSAVLKSNNEYLVT